MQQDIKRIIEQMTLEEKCAYVSGYDNWHTETIARLSVPAVMMSDGPHGLRKIDDAGQTVPATCFPSGAGLASSWDRELIYQVGRAIGEEAQAEGVDIVLGPACNIKRSPLCGRNFEYLSEDPYLCGQMARSHISGVQSKDVGTSLKHFCANNQESMRMRINEIIEERTLREIYLAGFEMAVKQAGPATVMCSYNGVNGSPLACNSTLLNGILRGEWGYDGIVMTDWGAIKQRAECIDAGLDLEMPGKPGMFSDEIKKAVESGNLEESKLDKAVERIMRFAFEAASHRRADVSYDRDEHHDFAASVAADCMVLLKNEDNVLPIRAGEKVAVIGEFAEKPRFQGGGSSHILPTKITSLLDALNERNADFVYEKGFSISSDLLQKEEADRAVEAAKQADKVIVMAGLPDHYESEGYDRTHMQLPPNQNELIEQLYRVNPNLTVVLSNGSPVELPWVGKVKSVLEGYLGGQASGIAVASILYGDVNPSGKLAESFPLRLEDNPSYLDFPGNQNTVTYREGVFVGYRYYDKKKMPVLFPFGHGLSYTTFEYEEISVSRKKASELDSVRVSVKVKNTGNRAGKEVVQLYVSAPGVLANRPPKELKGFKKIYLEPGEETTAEFSLDMRSFAYYDEYESGWICEPGTYTLFAGTSSRELPLCATIEFVPLHHPKLRVSPYMTVKEVLDHPQARKVIQPVIEQIREGKRNDDGNSAMNDQMMEAVFYECPLASLVTLYPENFTPADLENLMEQLAQYA